MLIMYMCWGSLVRDVYSVMMIQKIRKKVDKGRVRKIKMEIQDGICHEGGGGSRPVSSATYLF